MNLLAASGVGSLELAGNVRNGGGNGGYQYNLRSPMRPHMAFAVAFPRFVQPVAPHSLQLVTHESSIAIGKIRPQLRPGLALALVLERLAAAAQHLAYRVP